MPSTIQTLDQHIPAWKKLGLKLKDAKDELTVAKGGQGAAGNKKRKLPIEDYAKQSVTPPSSARLAKKSKKSAPSSNKSTVTATQNTISSASVPREQTSSPSPLPKLSSRKNKSVSFAPQTKTEDADSTKDLYNTWLASHLTLDPSYDPSKTSNPALRSITSPSASDPAATVDLTSNDNNKKKREKSKSTTLTQPSNPTGTEPPTPNKATLDYLQTYHTNRAHWKFSKTRQTQLLRSLFPPPPKPTPIPASYFASLHAYLSGLQGQSARSRLRAQALAVREDDEKWVIEDMEAVESKERRKEEYMKEVERVKELLEGLEDEREDREKARSREWWQRVQRRRVAEVALWGVGERDEPDEEKRGREEGVVGSGAGLEPAAGGEGVKKTLGKNGKPKRKRKRRTTGVPDDESSSTSSSSSSEDEDNRKEEMEKGRVVMKAKRVDEDGETSSSGSSSASGSDSGSSDGDGSASESESGSSSHVGESGSGSDSGSDGGE